MTPLKEYQTRFYARLEALYGPGETKALFNMAINDVIGIKARRGLTDMDPVLTEAQSEKLNLILDELAFGKPYQYILGHAYFMHLKLSVNKHVLIPRPETEELVDWILTSHLALSKKSLIILDIGTGSGCIAIALANLLSSAKIEAIDISSDAIQLAKKNAQEHRADVRFSTLDILEWDILFDEDKRYDVIVSNPPYITTDEQTKMHNNVLLYEPHLALFVDGTAPLLFYETIASFALKHLNKGGQLYFEINGLYGNEVCELLTKKGFSNITLKQDMQGTDRMVSASI